jgi:hypothetical protein
VGGGGEVAQQQGDGDGPPETQMWSEGVHA